MTVKAGDLFTKDGIDFRVQFIENDIAYGLKFRTQDRGVRNFVDSEAYRENLRVPVKELLATGAEKVK